MKSILTGKRLIRVLASAMLGVCLASAIMTLRAEARPTRVNLGTLAPRGSTYHRSLLSMAEKWRQAPGGGVRLVIYPDGTQGGESDMVRLMRVGTLHAGLLTANGLSDIDPAVAGLQNMPMMFRNLDEVDYVVENMQKMLEERLLAKGFIVLFWVDAGWVRYFSKERMIHPEDLKIMKAFVWAGDLEQVDIMNRGGYNPVPLETGEILPGFQTGLITAVSVPPIFALAGQLDTRAPYMINLNYAPLVGAAVITKSIWDRIPGVARRTLVEAAAEAGREIKANSRQESLDSVAAMQKRGLTVQPVTPELEEEWRKAAELLYPEIRGRVVPADMFDEVQRLLGEYRAGG